MPLLSLIASLIAVLIAACCLNESTMFPDSSCTGGPGLILNKLRRNQSWWGRGRREASVHVIPSLNREFHLVTGRMRETGPERDADRYVHLTGLLDLGPSLLSLMMARQQLVALPCKGSGTLYLQGFKVKSTDIIIYAVFMQTTAIENGCNYCHSWVTLPDYVRKARFMSPCHYKNNINADWKWQMLGDRPCSHVCFITILMKVWQWNRRIVPWFVNMYIWDFKYWVWISRSLWAPLKNHKASFDILKTLLG